MADESAVWSRLTGFADRQAPSLARALSAAIAALQRSVQVGEVEALLRRGDIEGAAALAFDPVAVRSAFQPVKHALTRALLGSGDFEFHMIHAMRGRLNPSVATASRRPRGLVVRLDTLAPGVLDALGAYERGPLTELPRALQDGFAVALRESIEAGTGPAALARRVRPLVGLTPRQAAAAARLRAELEGGQAGAVLRRELRDKRFDGVLASLLRDGRPLTAAKIDQIVAAYERKLVRHGTVMWARDTSLTVLHDGHKLAWEQTFQDRVLERETVLKRWVVSPDERVCEICAPIPGMNPPEGIPFDAMYETPKGPLWGPLAHYVCRCVNWVRPRVRRVI